MRWSVDLSAALFRATCQILAVWSRLAVMTQVPSEEKATQVTWSVWPSRVWMHSSVRQECQSLAVWSRLPVTTT